MADVYSSLGFDPIEGTEIMELLDLGLDDTKFHKSYNKIRDIIKYFQGRDDKRKTILKILSSRRHDDKLDAVWTYVQLSNEREAVIGRMNPEDFAENVQEDLKNKYLTKENMKLIKEQVNDGIERARKEKEALEKDNKTFNALKTRKLNKALKNLESYQEDVSQLELVTDALKAFE